jgi:hypothetical protein
MTQSGHSHQWMADLMADVRYWAKRTWKTRMSAFERKVELGDAMLIICE